MMSVSQPDTTDTASPDVETKLLGDCYAILLADIRRNRALRLAKQSESVTDKTTCDLPTSENVTSPANASSIEQEGSEEA